MICPDCNKFAAYDTSTDPEADLDIDDQANVTGSVRIVLTSECCGTELKEANFDLDLDFADDFPDCLDEDGDLKEEGHELSVEASCAEITDRYETTTKRTKKDGSVVEKSVEKSVPSRYQRRYFGVAMGVEVTCSCGVTAQKDFSDEVQASGMEELV